VQLLALRGKGVAARLRAAVIHQSALGEDNLAEYRFNTEKIAHLFCKTCGVQVFGRAEKDGVPMSGVNVRTIDGVGLAALKRRPFDGKSR